MTAQTVTLKDVVLCRPGKWKGLFGPVDMTREKFQSVVEAYQDAEVDRGVLRLGHLSSMNSALGDGAPAFGWIENPRIDEKDQLRGDLADIPKKLAGLIGRAYRQGSIEMRHNVTTPSGKTYPAVLRGFALLGNSAPAVKGMDPLPKIESLDDIADLYASEHPGADDECTAESEDLIMLGELDDSVIPTSHGEVVDTGLQDPGKARGNHQEETAVSYPKSTLDALGLPEDATEEQVNAAISERAAKPAAEESKPAEAEKPGEQPAEEKPEGGEVALSDLLEEYKGQVTALSEQLATVRESQRQRDVKDLMEGAKLAGRFGPKKADELVEKFGKDFAVLSEVVSTYEPGTINVVETGADTALSASTEDDADDFARKYLAQYNLG